MKLYIWVDFSDRIVSFISFIRERSNTYYICKRIVGGCTQKLVIYARASGIPPRVLYDLRYRRALVEKPRTRGCVRSQKTGSETSMLGRMRRMRHTRASRMPPHLRGYLHIRTLRIQMHLLPTDIPIQRDRRKHLYLDMVATPIYESRDTHRYYTVVKKSDYIKSLINHS